MKSKCYLFTLTIEAVSQCLLLVDNILRLTKIIKNKCKITYIPPGKVDKEDVSGLTMSHDEQNTWAKVISKSFCGKMLEEVF